MSREIVYIESKRPNKKYLLVAIATVVWIVLGACVIAIEAYHGKFSWQVVGIYLQFAIVGFVLAGVFKIMSYVEERWF